MSEEVQVPVEDEPKQKTPKGKEIPLPKRDDVMAAFKKIVKGKKP
jgi:hypothetical protein